VPSSDGYKAFNLVRDKLKMTNVKHLSMRIEVSPLLTNVWSAIVRYIIVTIALLDEGISNRFCPPHPSPIGATFPVQGKAICAVVV